ncbi:MAG: hypothetical protein ABIZ34_05600 [Candidatus Limnocylindrales bacterium]
MIGRRKPHADPVTEEVRAFVLNRDKVCFLSRTDLSHQCRDTWGNPHRSDDTDRLSLEHVHETGGMMGKRAPSDPAHLLALCGHANVAVPSKERRAAMRQYLELVNHDVA